MALKLQVTTVDGNEYAVVRDGKPVYVDDTDNQELAFDAEQARVTTATLNLEAAKNRTALKELKETLDKFKGANPEEIATFRKTLEEYGGIDGLAELKKKGSVDVEAIKKSLLEASESKYKQTVDQYEAKVAELSEQVGSKDSQIYKLMVSGQLATSKYVADKLMIPPDIVEAVFGKHFKIEEGQVVAYIGDSKVLSRERMGEPAGIDEALAVIVDKYPMKDRILKGVGGGSGAGPAGGAGRSGEKVISRAEFQAKSPAEQSKMAMEGFKITD